MTDAAPEADTFTSLTPPDESDSTARARASDPCGLRPEDLAADGPVTVETWLGAPALSFPRRPASVLAVLDRAVALRPDAPAVVDDTTVDVGDGPGGRGTTTTAALATAVEGCARALRRRGVGRGDAVAVAAGTSTDLLVLLLAVARVRAVLVGLQTSSSPTAWAYQLEHSGARLVVATPQHVDACRRAGAADVVDLRDLGRAPADAPGPADGWEPPAEDETFMLVYTSGTTGRPKASRVVHRASVHSGMAYQRLLGLREGESTSVYFALTYISALHAHVLPALLGGARLVLVDGGPRDLLRALAEHEVGWAYAVPSVWRLLTRSPALTRERLPRLERLAAGGAPFGPDLVAALRERLPGTRLHDVYGLSETHSPACVALDDDLEARPGSVGRPLPCLEAEVRDEAGRVLPAGEAGVLHLRGSLVTTGYAGPGGEAATAAAIRDGWFDTGDVVRADADGHLHVLDRVKDMVNRAGHKVFSAEVERVLREHPQVADCAVVGAPDRASGEVVVAFVVPEDPAAPPADADLRRHVREGLGEPAAPSRVHVVEDLPRTPNGKPDKKALRARLAPAA